MIHSFDERFLEDWLRWGRVSFTDALNAVVAGDTAEIVCLPTIPALSSGVGRTITKAWLSVKDKETDADATENAAWSSSSGARQSITTTETAGRGWIVSASESSAELRFDLTAANTAALTARQTYYFDVQLLMSDGAIYTVERGRFAFGKGVTAATS